MRIIALTLFAVTSLLGATLSAQDADSRPNILWIMLEDWSADLSCYGTKGLHTPNIDQLAADGQRFTHAFTTSPVCSTSRSAMITGFHQNYIGANQHRTRGKKPLPHGIKPMPQLLQAAGYYTALMISKKTDCNFTTGGSLFMGKDWKERKKGQPFFVQVTFEGTHRSWSRDRQRPIDEKNIDLPPYYPDVPMIRRDWANGLEQAQISDRRVGKLLLRLKDEGLAENTLVFLIGDHGRCMPRGKQFLYDGGIQIPMIARWPGKLKAGEVRTDMVMAIDITKTILDVAKVTPPHPLHGKNLFSGDTNDRKYVFAARDKMDSTHDSIRAIRSKQFKYMHNLMPDRAYCQFNSYKETSYPTLAVLNAMHLRGELNPVQAAFMAAKKPVEELYDLVNDPYETKNLATDPAHAATKKTLRTELDKWRKSINDDGPTDEFRSGGWSAKYPTKSLAQWEAIVKAWEPYVFRKPSEKASAPKGFIAESGIGKKPKKKKKDGKKN
ncbi:MAG: sulfatase [Lentisphaeria bacterium]|jgi:arylsulfatase A-like enzyme|nr:sulfatase [Lentisphaeria bacterium]|tara:strand:- start:1190 stop:2677 length:1488 start_codon:yes stop_codon:yes gene_type:complete